MSIDDVERTAEDFDRRLAAFYREAARRAEGDDVRDLFRSLSEQQEADRDKLKQSAEGVRRNA